MFTIRVHTSRWLRLAALAACAASLVAATVTPSLAAAKKPAASDVSITRAGRWLVDRQGRVVTMHGFNIVRKTAPFYPSHFDARDADFLVRNGFTAVRLGFIWSAVEPKPGLYDNRYIRHMIALTNLLARHGIHALVDFHQDEWSASAGGDGAPAWATLSNNFLSDFQSFWDNAPAADGVGIQTRFVAAWQHIVRMIDRSPGAPALIGLDPFNEPYAGLSSLCAPFVPCAGFEAGTLSDFYARVITAIRATGDRHVVFPEGVAQNGIAQPAVRKFTDSQTAFTFHFYCPVTQDATSTSPIDAACLPVEQHGVGSFLAYDSKLDVPGILGEFSCNDADDDNASMVDLADQHFTSWTAWMYYRAKADPANCAGQGLLLNDSRHGSRTNAKPGKLAAFVVPYPQAIAGAPGTYAYDRATRTMTLSYRAQAVPGTHLSASAKTTIVAPTLVYPRGYRVTAHGARVTSARDADHVELRAARPGSTVTVVVQPR